MKRRVMMVCLLALATASCGQVRSIMQPKEPQQQQQQVPQNGPLTLSGGSPNLSSPAPVQQTRATQNWRRDLPRNIPYFNMSDDAVGIYDEAARNSKNNDLLPGEGGFIETCDDKKPVCKMTFGNGVSGWVQMDAMAGVSN